jgi:hypothetical protein
MNGTRPTDAEQLRWQLRATRLVLDLLRRAQRQSLPPVTWTICDAGATVMIRCDTRTEWIRWVDATGLTDIWPERAHGESIHLHAVGYFRAGDGGSAQVTVLADLDQHFDSEVEDQPQTAPS